MVVRAFQHLFPIHGGDFCYERRSYMLPFYADPFTRPRRSAILRTFYSLVVLHSVIMLFIYQGNVLPYGKLETGYLPHDITFIKVNVGLNAEYVYVRLILLLKLLVFNVIAINT